MSLLSVTFSLLVPIRYFLPQSDTIVPHSSLNQAATYLDGAKNALYFLCLIYSCGYTPLFLSIQSQLGNIRLILIAQQEMTLRHELCGCYNRRLFAFHSSGVQGHDRFDGQYFARFEILLSPTGALAFVLWLVSYLLPLI